MSPLLAFPLIIRLIRCEVKGASYLLAIFMGIFAYCFPPMGDLSKLQLAYYSYDFMNIETYLEYAEKFDIVFWALNITFYHLGIKFEYIRLLFTMSDFLILAYIYERFTLTSSISHKSKMNVLAMLCIGFLPLYQILGLRHGLGICIYTLAIVKLYVDRKYVQSILLLFFAACVHYHFLPLMIITLGTYYINPIKRIRIFYILLIISFIIGTTLTPLLTKYFYSDASYADGYTSADSEYGSGYSYAGKAGIQWLIFRLWYMPLLYFVLKDKPEKYNDRVSFILKNLIYIYVIMVAFTWSYLTFSERTGKVLSMLLCLYICINMKRLRGLQKYLSLCVFLLVFVQLYSLRLLMFNTDNNLPYLFMPIPFILEQGYTIEWLDRYIDDGALILRGSHWSL